MWFRVEIKIIDDSSGMRYHWHEMTFCYRWDSKSCSILCLGVDASFRSCLQEKLQQIWPDIQGSQPGCLLVPLIEVLVITYDQSVWSMRDIVRQAEKVSYIVATNVMPRVNTTYLRTVRIQLAA